MSVNKFKRVSRCILHIPEVNSNMQEKCSRFNIASPTANLLGIQESPEDVCQETFSVHLSVQIEQSTSTTDSSTANFLLIKSSYILSKLLSIRMKSTVLLSLKRQIYLWIH